MIHIDHFCVHSHFIFLIFFLLFVRLIQIINNSLFLIPFACRQRAEAEYLNLKTKHTHRRMIYCSRAAHTNQSKMIKTKKYEWKHNKKKRRNKLHIQTRKKQREYFQLYLFFVYNRRGVIDLGSSWFRKTTQIQINKQNEKERDIT